MIYKHEVVEPCAMYVQSSWECLSKGNFHLLYKNKQTKNKKQKQMQYIMGILVFSTHVHYWAQYTIIYSRAGNLFW